MSSTHPPPIRPIVATHQPDKYWVSPAARKLLQTYVVPPMTFIQPRKQLHHTYKNSNHHWMLLGMLSEIDIALFLVKCGIERNPGPEPTQILNKLTVAHININSITSPTKIEELNQFVVTSDVKILAITETKLDDSVNSSMYQIKGFHSPLTKHRNRHGGGVAVYVHTSLPVQHLKALELSEHEWLWAKIKLPALTLIICCTYLPPNLSAQQQQSFIDDFSESVCEAQKHSPAAILTLGDFNTGNIYLDHHHHNHNGTSSFDHTLKDAADALDLKQLIIEPTRISQSSSNLRDLIFTSNDNIISNSGTLSSFGQLDHFPIYATIQIPTVEENKLPVTKNIWDYSKTNIPLLTETLQNVSWDDILQRDIHTATDTFISTLQEAARLTIPIKQINLNHRQKTWINGDLKRNIRKRDRLFKTAKRTNDPNDWNRWKIQRNCVTAINKRLKSQYLKGQVDKLLTQRRDPHKYHQTLRNITGRFRDDTIPPLETSEGNIITDNPSKVTALNDYFAAQTFLDISDEQEPPPNTNTQPVPVLANISTTEQEVLYYLNSIDPNKSTGPDNIPTKFLKMTALLIAKPLAMLFNASLSSGIYPNAFKEANVRPIFKNKGSPSDFTSYRPISLLSPLSKIFEKIVYKQMYSHFTENNLLTDKQSGYRKNHSTQDQLLYLTDNLYKSLDDGHNFTAVYLDISKYFDTIWHKGLLYKCEHEFGITGQLLNWLKSYLTDRKQRVILGNDLSPLLTLKAGCPQGSVLGPLLALIYLNKLSTKTKNDILFFADDTSLYSPHATDIQLTQTSLQDDLDVIYNYGKDWAITFNPAKTIQQTFSHQRTPQIPKLTFGGHPIPIKQNHTHLGVTLSTDLRFHEHINNICQKVNKTLGPLYPIARYLPRQILDQIYKIYIRPHFDYCDAIYDGHITIRDTTRLETLQNRTARLVTGTLFRTPTDKLRKELGWELLTQRRQIHKLILYHKLSDPNQPTPNYITSRIPNTRARDTNILLRNANTHTRLPHRTSSYYKSFFPATIRNWNQLPETIRNQNHKSFKKEIRERLGLPDPPKYYSFGTKEGNILHTRIRTEMTYLNSHLYKILKCPSPMCDCGYPDETSQHFVLSCPKYANLRTEMINTLTRISLSFADLEQPQLFLTLVHGADLCGVGGRAVARAFQKFLIDTGRLT